MLLLSSSSSAAGLRLLTRRGASLRAAPASYEGVMQRQLRLVRRFLFEGKKYRRRGVAAPPPRASATSHRHPPRQPNKAQPPSSSRWDETSVLHRGPVPRLFYVRHHDTLLQPQHSGASAWAGLGALTVTNFVVLGLWNTTTTTADADDDREEWMMANFTTNVTNLWQGRPWTLATSSISHMDLGHFGGNMFAMWLFGFYTYRVIGTAAFYGLYLVGGVACSTTHVLHNLWTGKTQPPLTKSERESLELFASEYGPHAIDRLPPAMTERLAHADKPSLGASGSVMAIAAVAAALFPLDQMRYRNMYLPLPVAAGIFVLSDLSGLLSEGSPTDHAGHLGGLLMGAVYVTTAWYSKGRFLKSFQILRNVTGGDLPIVYRYKQMMQKNRYNYRGR